MCRPALRVLDEALGCTERDVTVRADKYRAVRVPEVWEREAAQRDLLGVVITEWQGGPERCIERDVSRWTTGCSSTRLQFLLQEGDHP